MPVVLTPVQRSVAASEEYAQACKQEEKLMKELVKMTNITSASGYKSKAPQHVQEAHSLKVRYRV
jgi:valyl-tRNA synthetase